MIVKILMLMAISAINAEIQSYEGYKVYKVFPTTKQQVEILSDVQKTGVGEFWEDNIVSNNTAKVMVSKNTQEVFLSHMKLAGIEAVVVIEDLQKAIDDQMKPANPTRFGTENFHSMTWDRYYSIGEIYAWLDQLENTYPNIVKTVVWGRTFEDREIKGIIINYRPERENKLIGVIEGALHAREWITPATITWIIKEFLTSNNAEVRTLAETFEWHILPIANPDGYSYTFTHHRMWRKNRNTVHSRTCAQGVNDDMSNGVDLNRNFGFQWMTVGASDDPCTNTFAGAQAFSELESRAIANYVQSLKEQGEIIYYLAIHSYTQLLIIPYSHLTSADDVLMASNYANMYEIGIRAARKLEERFGTHYRVGISAEVLYPMSGASFDWVKHDIEVPVCYLLELRDLGEYGFLLPPEQIIPNNLEVMDFILEMDRSTRDLGYYTAGVSSILYSSGLIVISICLTLLR